MDNTGSDYECLNLPSSLRRDIAEHGCQMSLACRGKLLNVRDASVTQINGNAEINAIKQILGLQHGKVSAVAPLLSKPLSIHRVAYCC